MITEKVISLQILSLMIDNDELVSACVEAEGAKENEVQNVGIVYRRTGCNRWENMCSRILM